jgi:peptide/nickel transport system substrate-binding protein
MSPEEMGPRDGGPEPFIEGLADPRAPWEELVEDPAAPRALLAVMFTDIIGSTELATHLGDKRWRELLEQHDAAIREQIARFDGREVDTAGDAFFATFGLAVRAVDCALESARAVRRLGLRIRAGVHMGECVVSDGKVRGVTVHIGARVGAKARGDEVLVSSTVRDILAGAGLKFVDRGEQTLKGVEGRWRLYAVEPRARDNEADLPPLLEAQIAAPPVPWWKRRRTLVAGVAALAVLAGAIAFVVSRGGGLSTIPPDSVAAIDAASGDVLSAVPVRRRPVGIAAAPDGVWVANSIDGNVTHIGRDGRRDETIPVGRGPISVASGGDLIWVANGDGRSVSRVSARTGGVVGDPIEAGNGLSAVGYGANALWLANAVDGTVWRVDPSTGGRLKDIAVGPGLRGLEVTRDAIWVTSETAGTVTRIDPASGLIVRVVRVGNGPGAVAAGERSLWVANAFDGTVSRIDPRSGTVRATIRVGQGPRAIAIAKGRVFVANEESETISVIEARTGRLVRTIAVGNAPMGMAASGDRVWVSVRGGIPTYRGGTLRIGNSYVPPSFDPTFHDFAITAFFTAATHDGLTAFKRVGGTEGNQLVPNLVEDIRAPSKDGLTYSFTLRPEIKFSDGSPLRASDVKATFERVVRNEAYGAGFIAGIKGTEACAAGKPCDLSSGIVVDDRSGTIVFHLRQANADFPYVLALPNLTIVPRNAPATDAGTTPVPGTGPYRLVRATIERDGQGNPTKATAVLERNRYFRSRGPAQPDAYPDRIELKADGTPNDHVEAVRKGAEDVTFDVVDPGVQINRIATELPAQLHVFDVPTTAFVTLNPRVAPFNDVRARRALNYAIDRREFIRATFRGELLAEPSCQLFTENIIGYAPHCPFTKSPGASGVWTEPDLATARRLVRESGTAGQSVTIFIEEADNIGSKLRRASAPIVVSALRAIGYRASVRPVPNYFETITAPNSRHQVALAGWVTDYPGAANYVLPLVTCPDTLARIGSTDQALNLVRFCSPEVDKLTQQALALQRDDAAAAAALWASVDRALTDAAPLVNVASLRTAMLTSRRVGNVQGHATYYSLISQMWLTDRR